MPETPEVFLENNVPNWIRPNLEGELHEIQRVAVDFLSTTATPETVAKIIDALNAAPLVDLSDADWEQLENTDSFHNVKPGHIEDVEKIVEGINAQLPDDKKRSLPALQHAFATNGDMEAPTILRNGAGELHLVSGNTRLMLSRALMVRPKVIIADFK